MTPHERVLRQLLPPGVLFDEIPDDSVLAKLLKGLSLEFERIDQRAADLVAEMDPRTATETLPEWERAYGLPDVRVPVLPSTTAGRRAAIVLKVIMRGAQNESAYRALVEACGWQLLEVRKAWFYEPFNCESECDSAVDEIDWANTVHFIVGGEAVDALPLADLTSVLQHTMQAHAFALVTYAT
ncbi:MAG: putative phage tail protein [Archangium sp.]